MICLGTFAMWFLIVLIPIFILGLFHKRRGYVSADKAEIRMARS